MLTEQEMRTECIRLLNLYHNKMIDKYSKSTLIRAAKGADIKDVKEMMECLQKRERAYQQMVDKKLWKVEVDGKARDMTMDDLR